MKHLLFVISILLFSPSLFSQSIKIKGEKVLINKELYCYLKSGGNPMSVWSYSIKNTAATELIFLKSNTVEINKDESKVYYTFTISETGENFEIEQIFLFKKGLIKYLYEYELIKDDKINEVGLEKFKRMFAGNFGEQYAGKTNQIVSESSNIQNNNPTTDNYILIERNRKAHIFVTAGKIKQDGKEIATYEKETVTSDGKIIKTIRIYNIKQHLVAQLEFENFEKEITIITLI